MSPNSGRKHVYEAIAPLLRGHADLATLAERMRQLKDAGCTQRDSYDALIDLRKDVNSELLEERLLDLMDIICGWCRSESRIWPTELRP